MKLYYYQRPDGVSNFGDSLNPWLWNQLIPEVLNEDENIAFIGIGTLINDKLVSRTPKAFQRVIFSSGVGHVKVMPEIDSSYKIYCLRGPLSAKTLGVAPELAITDGAVLLRRVVEPNNCKVHQFSYMPHHRLADDAWNLVCQELGWGFIDPRWSLEKIISCINETEILLAEAMHGAIAADALRVPWIPIVTHSVIDAFKWQDWCQSLGLEYQPVRLNPIHPPQKQTDLLTPLRLARSWFQLKSAGSQLIQVTKDSCPFLSSDSTIARLTVRLEEKLQQLKHDAAIGAKPVSHS